jgi:hypothetical protein
VEVKHSDRLRTRLFAITLRLAELEQEIHRTALHVRRLETRLEEARLARLMGEDAGNPAEIGPELERFRGDLEAQREFVAGVRRSQWKARVEYTVARALERRREREQAQAAPEERE